MTVPWRESTAEEVRQYYHESFPEMIDGIPERCSPPNPTEYGIAFRERHPAVGDDVPPRNFVRRDTWITTRDGDLVRPVFNNWRELLEWIQGPAHCDPLRGESKVALVDPQIPQGNIKPDPPVPEAVYYTLQQTSRPWVLMVDIDAKDVAKERTDDIEQVTETEPPIGKAYSFDDLQQAIEYGFSVQRLFEQEFNADETSVVYSGQGVHVYLLDTDREHRYDERSRQVIAELLHRKYGVPVDKPVTSDPSRFGRMLYSLHAGVSRVVQPISSPSFDPRTDAVPPFLADQHDQDTSQVVSSHD